MLLPTLLLLSPTTSTPLRFWVGRSWRVKGDEFGVEGSEVGVAVGCGEYCGFWRAAITNSGSVIPAEDVSTAKAQAIYDKVVASSSCAGSSDSLTCLRGLSYADFLRAVSSVPGIFSYRSLDLSYLPRPDPGGNFFSQSPEVSIANGAYAKAPVIIGDQED
ncbi:uncharacterized protein MYCFIDRAFT_199464 [Pseudocercospora fijiensis CIRAD86]|uniref:Uncharacterized protein n=1 Tax=Pseudocercospora fijiensis (strain CIRAD86) TaxID=383855 RepID=M2ZL70_PSEFD|nr:uncharacterized protein MYCFIDRAFT_199464 [Pseudocercospora fijiensis CIRAD86]EME79809.1 hypothetical protein MYCFIDRAFT_199464 [Pseudocercospora fijiensis CIRAD86]